MFLVKKLISISRVPHSRRKFPRLYSMETSNKSDKSDDLSSDPYDAKVCAQCPIRHCDIVSGYNPTQVFSGKKTTLNCFQMTVNRHNQFRKSSSMDFNRTL